MLCYVLKIFNFKILKYSFLKNLYDNFDFKHDRACISMLHLKLHSDFCTFAFATKIFLGFTKPQYQMNIKQNNNKNPNNCINFMRN